MGKVKADGVGLEKIARSRATTKRQATSTPKPWWKRNRLDPNFSAAKSCTSSFILSQSCNVAEDDDVERLLQEADAKR